MRRDAGRGAEEVVAVRAFDVTSSPALTVTTLVVAVDTEAPVGEVARQLLGHYRSLLVACNGVVSREDLLRALTS